VTCTALAWGHETAVRALLRSHSVPFRSALSCWPARRIRASRGGIESDVRIERPDSNRGSRIVGFSYRCFPSTVHPITVGRGRVFNLDIFSDLRGGQVDETKPSRPRAFSNQSGLRLEIIVAQPFIPMLIKSVRPSVSSRNKWLCGSKTKTTLKRVLTFCRLNVSLLGKNNRQRLVRAWCAS
jgi:hypothetical protein